MKILFVSAILPYPLHSGGQVRLYNLLKLLSREHEITLYSYIRNEEERKFIPELSFLKEVKLYFRGSAWQPKYILRSLMSTLPLLVSSYEHDDMKHDIALDLYEHSYDVVHCEPFYVYPVLPKSMVCPLVIAEHNIEYDVYLSYVNQFSIPMIRPFLRFDVRKMKKKEELIWKQAKKVITVSKEDASIITACSHNTLVTVVPNGVDIENFHFNNKVTLSAHPKLLFVGNFLWIPNMKAVQQLLNTIWPSIVKTIPLATLTIVGKHLSPKVQAEAKSQGIMYEEFVKDIRKMYQNADMLLAPMTIAGGTKFKILEAMASGCLVLTTKEGMEGIEAKKDIHYLEITSASSAVQAIQSVMKDSKKFQTITKKARILIESMYDWKHIATIQSDIWKK